MKLGMAGQIVPKIAGIITAGGEYIFKSGKLVELKVFTLFYYGQTGD